MIRKEDLLLERQPYIISLIASISNFFFFFNNITHPTTHYLNIIKAEVYWTFFWGVKLGISHIRVNCFLSNFKYSMKIVSKLENHRDIYFFKSRVLDFFDLFYFIIFFCVSTNETWYSRAANSMWLISQSKKFWCLDGFIFPLF